MSRSYRKPFTAVTGVASAHADKTMAARCMRRKQNLWLRNLVDYDSALMPHRSECTFNNTWCWGRDGGQFPVFPYDRYVAPTGSAHRDWVKLQRK